MLNFLCVSVTALLYDCFRSLLLLMMVDAAVTFAAVEILGAVTRPPHLRVVFSHLDRG